MNSEIANIGKAYPEKIVPKISGGKKLGKAKEAVPIGVFDSGVGGLTVLSQMMQQMPHEDIVYLADTLRLPYGGRPPEEIIEINRMILDYFENLGVKMVVMACGTSSAIAYPVLKDEYSFPIVSLINPGAHSAVSATRNSKIGLIATLGTVSSGAYQKAINEIESGIHFFAQSCPLFVPLIEGGFIDADETRRVAREYLKPLLKADIDTLILGCTHYPHLKNILREIAGPDVVFVDPAEYAVTYAKEILAKSNIANSTRHKAKHSYVVTGDVNQFEELGSRLLGKPIVQAKQIIL